MRTLQWTNKLLPNSCGEKQESCDLQGFLQYPAHEIFRYVSIQAERKLNIENAPRMNCVNIVESTWREQGGAAAASQRAAEWLRIVIFRQPCKKE